MKFIPLHSLVIALGDQPLTMFPTYEIVSAKDILHELVGDATHQDIDGTIFNEVRRRTNLKLGLGERAIINAQLLRREDRVSLAHVGIAHGVPIFYLVSALDETDGQTREILRGDSIAEVITNTDFQVVAKLPDDGMTMLSLLRERGYTGITVVGDVHGMYQSFLNALTWARNRRHFMVLLGDILDYGRQSLDVIDEVYRLVMRGEAELIMGNHERKILRWLDQYEDGHVTIKLSPPNRVTTDAIEALSPNDRKRWSSRFRALMALSRQHRCVNAFLFVHGAAHDLMWHDTNRRLPNPVEMFALFGQIDRDNPSKEDGYPRRIYDWCDLVPKGNTVIVGHDIRSTERPVVHHGTAGGVVYFIDTGCGKTGSMLSSVDLQLTEQGLRFSNFNLH